MRIQQGPLGPRSQLRRLQRLVWALLAVAAALVTARERIGIGACTGENLAGRLEGRGRGQQVLGVEVSALLSSAGGRGSEELSAGPLISRVMSTR